MGPKTEPCGTPYLTAHQLNTLLSSLVQIMQLEKYDCIRLNTWPRITIW